MHSQPLIFRSLLPDCVSVEEGGLYEEAEAQLLSPEQELIKASLPKRRLEFATGRLFSRRALQRLDVQPAALLCTAEGLPIWPRGIVGSITHCNDYCAVAVAKRSDISDIGIDVETIGRVSPETVAYIASAGEQRNYLSVGDEEEWHLRATILFCAKESLIKCFHAFQSSFQRMSDFELNLDLGNGTFTAPGITAAGAFARNGHHIAAACWQANLQV